MSVRYENNIFCVGYELQKHVEEPLPCLVIFTINYSDCDWKDLIVIFIYTTNIFSIKKLCLVNYILCLIHTSIYYSYLHILMYDKNIIIKKNCVSIIRCNKDDKQKLSWLKKLKKKYSDNIFLVNTIFVKIV